MDVEAFLAIRAEQDRIMRELAEMEDSASDDDNDDGRDVLEETDVVLEDDNTVISSGNYLNYIRGRYTGTQAVSTRSRIVGSLDDEEEEEEEEDDDEEGGSVDPINDADVADFQNFLFGKRFFTSAPGTKEHGAPAKMSPADESNSFASPKEDSPPSHNIKRERPKSASERRAPVFQNFLFTPEPEQIKPLGDKVDIAGFHEFLSNLSEANKPRDIDEESDIDVDEEHIIIEEPPSHIGSMINTKTSGIIWQNL